MKFHTHPSTDKLFFDCPGCKMPHGISHGAGEGPRWSWNGDCEKPTVSPSILARYPWGDPPADMVCHSFIADGKIQFLGDCTHELAGQTVDLPEWGSFE